MSKPSSSSSGSHRELESTLSALKQSRRLKTIAEAQEMMHLAKLYEIAFDRGIASESPKGVELSFRSMQAEVAALHNVSDRTVANWLNQAHSLTRFPRVFAEFSRGGVNKMQALAIAVAGDIVTDEKRRDLYERTLLAEAPTLSVPRLRKRAERIAEALASEPLPDRHEEAMQRRSVYVRDAGDGMAELCIYTSAVTAEAMHERLTRMAKRVCKANRAKGELRTDYRTRGNIMVDLATDLVLTGAPNAHGQDGVLGHINAKIQIITPALSLLPADKVARLLSIPELQDIAGLAGSPELYGYGPIGEEIVRLFAAHEKRWDNVVMHPSESTVITVEQYRPTASQRRFLTARDVWCRFPGCITPVRKADLDHTLEAANGGATSTDNLAYLCRRHHTLKHHELHESYRWEAEQTADGTITWTSPIGNVYLDEPVSRVMFLPVGAHQDRGSPDSDEPAPF